MNTTRPTRNVPFYIGADLTDRYSPACRDIDVCGLDSSLRASFWSWQWDAGPAPLVIDPIRDELSQCRCAMLDGPQGLARAGRSLRESERASGAPGKTSCLRPSKEKPFATYIWSSLDLFKALFDCKMPISPPGFCPGVSEVYPGHIWMVLAGRPLPKKNTDAGRKARKALLESLGVRDLPGLPTHDQSDACIAAVMAAAADGRIPGLRATQIGMALQVDPDGTLREGPMAVPEINGDLRRQLMDRAPVD